MPGHAVVTKKSVAAKRLLNLSRLHLQGVSPIEATVDFVYSEQHSPKLDGMPAAHATNPEFSIVSVIRDGWPSDVLAGRHTGVTYK